MATKELYLGDYLVNSTSEPYLIAEIGINHNGDMQIAKKLMDAVFATGWNCVKFQKRTPDIAVPETQKNVMRETPWGQMTYLEYKKRIEFERPEYELINTYCSKKPLAWSASPWDLPSLEFILNYDIPFIKIPSALNNNEELLKEACFSAKPIIVATGMSTLDEMDKTVEMLEKYGNGDYILLHTNSCYPAKYEDLNLRMIQVMKERYNCLVGYSGHETDLEPSVVAAALGAQVIERHITLSHDMWGTDQSSSLEVHAMYFLRRRILSIKDIIGDGKKKITLDEMSARKKLRGN